MLMPHSPHYSTTRFAPQRFQPHKSIESRIEGPQKVPDYASVAQERFGSHGARACA